jgi:hypothetical protein
MAPRLLMLLMAKIAPVLLLLVAFVAGQAASVAAPAPRGDGNPFDQLQGDWTGGGMVTPTRGDPEKVDCKVSYTTAGTTITQTLLCTGIDNQFDAKTKFKLKDGKISGSWLETTFDASGNISGSAVGHLVHARISGDKFSGRMSINVSDSGHTINIVQLNNKTGAYHLAASFDLHR